MKRVIILLAAIAVTTALNAQTPANDSFPYWTISKDVHRIQFKHVKLVPSTIQTTTLAPAVSKPVQTSRVVEKTGLVVRTGTPAHVVSKGIVSLQTKK